MRSKQGMVALLIVLTMLMADFASAASNPFKKLGEDLRRIGQRDAQHVPALAGSWLGYASVGTTPYPVFVSFVPGVAPHYAYALVNCSGPLVSEGRRGAGYRYQLQLGGCSAPPRMQLTPNGAQLRWDQLDARGNVVMSAFLARTDQTQAAQATASTLAAQSTAQRNVAATQSTPSATAPRQVMPGNARAQQAEVLRMGLEQAHLQL